MNSNNADHVLDGQVIFVTGGTGSFGRAFTRRVLDTTKAKKVIVFSRDEQKHYRLQQEYSDPPLPNNLHPPQPPPATSSTAHNLHYQQP